MSQKALFLDRDGVINVEKNYLYKIDEVEFIEDIFELCRFYQAEGFKIIVVTNQSGIARGIYTMEDFELLMAWMQKRFKAEGIDLSAVYCCPHHPDITGVCSCRKPEPGMIMDAIEAYDIDPRASFLIGDSERDIKAAWAAGLKAAYLLSTESKKSSATAIISGLNELIKEPFRG